MNIFHVFCQRDNSTIHEPQVNVSICLNCPLYLNLSPFSFKAFGQNHHLDPNPRIQARLHTSGKAATTTEVDGLLNPWWASSVGAKIRLERVL